jgi:hypothetical protein
MPEGTEAADAFAKGKLEGRHGSEFAAHAKQFDGVSAGPVRHLAPLAHSIAEND